MQSLRCKYTRKLYTIRKLITNYSYVVGQTCSDIFCTLISETFGRRSLYLFIASLFCIFNAVIAAMPSLITVFFGHFITCFVSQFWQQSPLAASKARIIGKSGYGLCTSTLYSGTLVSFWVPFIPRMWWRLSDGK